MILSSMINHASEVRIMPTDTPIKVIKAFKIQIQWCNGAMFNFMNFCLGNFIGESFWKIYLNFPLSALLIIFGSFIDWPGKPRKKLNPFTFN